MSQARLLTIDDDMHFAEFVRAVAEGLDFHVVWADSAAGALRECDAFQPSIILLDLKMPDGDGVELLRSLAQYGSKSDIILCSGVDARLMRSALRIGQELGLRIVGSLGKPVGMAELEEALREHVSARPEIAPPDLRRALDEEEISLHWQPKVSVASGAMCGAEALARWQRPDGWSMGPGDFIPLFEAAGMIDALTFSVLNAAARQVHAWNQRGLEVRAAVNLSSRAVSDLSLPDRCSKAVAACAVDPSQFVFEVTESAMMADALRAAEVLSRLRLKGFGLALDDFGTGYSSLARLQQLPFSELKLDRSLVEDLGRSEDAEILVRSTIDLAHNLGLEACVEGIETEEGWNKVRELGGDSVQGYYISRPLAPEDFAKWVSDRG